MVTGMQRKRSGKSKQTPVKSIKVEFADDPVTSFGGMVLPERLALRLSLWNELASWLPERRGNYSWLDIIKSAVAGLLTGSQGTVACDEVREEEALRKLLGVDGSPEEATFWRALAWLGQGRQVTRLTRTLCTWALRVLKCAKRQDLLEYGFLPLFGDGSLLEGSARREGTKYIKDKGQGLLWTTWFVGPVLAYQEMAGSGAGEARGLRRGLWHILRDVIDPLRMRDKCLALLDSLHGDGPTCSRLEREGLHYIVGALKLAETQRLLADRCEEEWQERGARANCGWIESAVCTCWLQCKDWTAPRLLVGRRSRSEGDLPGVYHYWGVLTDLRETHVGHIMKEGLQFADAIWRLYDSKAGKEDYYKDVLQDMAGHHPPCQELPRNRAYYALLSLANALARGVDLIGNASVDRGSSQRQDGGERRHARPKRMRLWRLRRRLFTLPGRVAYHARQVTVKLMGVSDQIRKEFEACLLRLSLC